MRRSDREILDVELVKEFLEEEEVVRFALKDKEGTYIVPVNYGFEDEDGTLCLYTHGAAEGRKAEALRKAACSDELIPFEIDGQHAPVIDDGCDASYYYMCVMGHATVEVLEGEEKTHALEAIMNGIMPAEEYHFVDEIVERTMLCKFTIKGWTCKKH